MVKLFESWSENYAHLWKAIIRPPRDEYEMEDLGPSKFHIAGLICQRTDFELTNPRGLKLKCSHFEPVDRVTEQLPCVIYLHGNCSSRVEALPCVAALLPSNITLLCLDLSGSGKSDGEYVSLGYHERDDLSTVVNHLRASGTTSLVALWGRSMGATTSLLHGDRDPSIAGMILDSPFSDLRKLAEELVGDFVSTKVPRFMVKFGLSFIRSSIKSRAFFDINDLTPIDHVAQTFIPAFFVAAEDDTFVKPDHTMRLFERYAGDKRMMIVPGSHNSSRPQFTLDAISGFLFNSLQCGSLPPRIHRPVPLGLPRIPRTRGIKGMGVGGSAKISEDIQLQEAIQASLAID